MTDSEGRASIFLIPFPVPVHYKKPVVCLLTTWVKTPRRGRGESSQACHFFMEEYQNSFSAVNVFSVLLPAHLKRHPLVTPWNFSRPFNWIHRPKTSLIIWISRLNNTINESACWLQPQICVILEVFAHLVRNTSLLYRLAKKNPKTLESLFECPRNVIKYIYSDTVFPLSLYFYFTRIWWQILYFF